MDRVKGGGRRGGREGIERGGRGMGAGGGMKDKIYDPMSRTINQDNSNGSFLKEKSESKFPLSTKRVAEVPEVCKHLFQSRYFWKCVLLGQFVSLLLCGTAVFSGLLSNNGIHIPTAQSFLNYVLLCLTFTLVLACRQGDRNLKTCLVQHWWKYLLIALADVEANYLVVKAYSYTTVTSVQLLDCFSIPVVLVLSVFILKVHYRLVHYVGVVVCVIGLGGLVATDLLSGNNKEDGDKAPDKILGDVLCIAGALLYGISNTAEEYIVKNYDRTEYLGMLGLFGSLINGIQFVILERHEISDVDFSSPKTVLYLLGFVLCLYLLYSCMAVVIRQTSATTVNISILSADFYTLLFGLFLFHYQFHLLYFVSFGVILLGIALYSSVVPGHRGQGSSEEAETLIKVEDEEDCGITEDG
ncbi:hypothetical protein FSP39_013368 [Pinctada imbricata]|uniref:Solute carrier family 35 member F2 n=1 Tax=Pinctada imbricata TaxID=66713 RepID=A0AA88Y3M0_PINIB|nr:hypothetical protein FSP39_013368 [Pinctada imbricata]